MKYFNTQNIVYLEDSEFTSDGQLFTRIINPVSKQPYFSNITIVMIQGIYCGYCTQFKPVFQQVADELYTIIDFATIQTDGEQPGEKIFQGDAMNIILRHELPGVPYIVKFYKGKVVDVFNGDRNYNSLKQWVLDV